MRKSDIVIDPRFFVPSNILDVVHAEYDNEDVYVNGEAESPTDSGLEGGLPIPSVDFTVVSQTLKVAPDGRLTVDVVVELPDNQSGVYEVRTTKIVN